MQYGLTSTLNHKLSASLILNWIFGSLVCAIGLVNIIWGNDQAFGAFLLMLSFIYFPTGSQLISEITLIVMPPWMKVLLGVFIIVAALGVGELPAKIDMMLGDLR